MDFEIINHGIDHAQYFPGCGVAFSHFDDCFTGCGSSPAAAFGDALDQLAMDPRDDDQPADYGIKSVHETVEESDEGKAIAACEAIPSEIAEQPEDGELYYYVSIRVRWGD